MRPFVLVRDPISLPPKHEDELRQQMDVEGAVYQQLTRVQIIFICAFICHPYVNLND